MWLKTLVIGLIVLTTFGPTIQQQNISTPFGTSDIYNKNLQQLNNLSGITNQINGVFKSLNLTDIEVNIILNTAEPTNENGDLDSLKYLFEKTIAENWYSKYYLKTIVETTNNITIYEILYKVLWHELKQNRYKSNAFEYIELYEDIQNILETQQSSKLSTLQNEIESNIIEHAALILRSYFIQNSTIQHLLNSLYNLNITNIYENTIEKLFENLETLEYQWSVSEKLLNFNLNTTEAIVNHIKYIEYLKSLDEYIPKILNDNIELLMSRPDFTKIPSLQRQQSSKLFSTSMGNLYAAQKICIKNITTNNYLYECPQTYLMCTNHIENSGPPINRKKAAFEVQRVGDKQYILLSPFWSRYFRLQGDHNATKSLSNTTLASSTITKSLYSHRESSNWLFEFQGNYSAIRDPLKSLYVCGGDSRYWSKVENHTYTRNSNDFIDSQCLWLLEDCSDVE